MLNGPRKEKRKFGRRTMACYGMVQVDTRQPIPCTVSNLSREGALLEFSEAVPDSETFRLVIEALDIDVVAQIRHRDNNKVGVYFKRPSAPEVKTPEQGGNSLVQEMRTDLS